MMRHVLGSDYGDLAEAAHCTGSVSPGTLEYEFADTAFLDGVAVASAALKQPADDFARALRMAVEKIAAYKVAMTAILMYSLIVHIDNESVLIADGDGAVQPPGPVRYHIKLIHVIE